jgi:hypothetical protein
MVLGQPAAAAGPSEVRAEVSDLPFDTPVGLDLTRGAAGHQAWPPRARDGGGLRIDQEPIAALRGAQGGGSERANGARNVPESREEGTTLRRILLVVAAIGIISLSGIGSAVAGQLRQASSNADTAAQATVPSGATIQGAVGGDFDAHAAVLDWGIDASLPARARNFLRDADVYVSVSQWVSGAAGQVKPTTTDTNAGCTGTRSNPTAPAGKVCIYVTGGNNAQDLKGYSIVPGARTGNPLGFKLLWTNTTTGDTFIDAVWAYHAP